MVAPVMSSSMVPPGMGGSMVSPVMSNSMVPPGMDSLP
jgi:hypothetical protein